MEIQTFHFEIRDIISQFIAAFDDVVINRYDKNRNVRSNVKVRYVYSPKERVLFDIVNKAQNMTLPVIAVNVNSISRDESRVFSKVYGFDESDHFADNKPGKNYTHINMPVPIDISINMSILTEYQTDMDQILSNFIPYTNPYVVISWKIPDDMGIKTIQELRSPVIWGGDMNMTYPIDSSSSDKNRIEASTSFVIKGWLFPKSTPKQQNVFFVTQNFKSSLLEDAYCSNIPESGSVSLGVDTKTIIISAAPICKYIYFNGILINDDFEFQSEEIKYPFILLGENFTNTTNLYLSSKNTILSSFITISDFDYYPSISAYNLPLSCYKVLNDYTIELTMPDLISDGKFDIIIANRAGWSKFENNLNVVDATDDSLFGDPSLEPVILDVMGKYFYSLIDNDWYNLGNWYADSAMTVAATLLPDDTQDVVILENTLRPVVDLDNPDWANPLSIDASAYPGITFTSQLNNKVASPILGDVIYQGNAGHV